MSNSKVKVEITGDNKHLKRTFAESEKVVKTSSNQMAASVGAAGKMMGAAFAAVVSARMITNVIKLADSFTNLESQLKLVTTSTENLTAVQSELFEIAQNSRVAFADTVSVYARFARATEEAGVSQRELLTVVEGLNRAVIVSGATANESEAAMLQLSQGMASGVLRGQELNSVMEQTPRIARMLADGLGVGIGKLREMGKAGELTTDKVVKALLEQSAVVESEFGQMSMTVGQSWTKITNSMGKFVDMGNDTAGVTGLIAEKFSDVSGWIDKMADPSSTVATNLEGIFNATSDIYGVLGTIDDLGGPSAGEWGVIGYALLRGGPQAAALTGALIGINEQLAHYKLNLGNLVEASKGFGESANNLIDVFTGKRDWNTGALIDPIVTLKDEIAATKKELAEIENLSGPFKFLNDLAGGQEDVEYLNNKINSLTKELGLLEGSGVGATDVFMGLNAAYGRTSKETEALSVTIEKNTLSWQELAKAQHDGMMVGQTDMFMGAQAADSRAEEAMKAMADEEKAAKDLAAGRASAYRDMFNDMENSAQDNFDHQLGLLNQQRTEYQALKLDQLKIDEWYHAEVSDLEDERLLRTGDFFDGVRLYLQESEEDFKSWAERSYEATAGLVDGMESTLGDWLGNALMGKFDSMGDAWDALWTGMLQTVVDTVAQMAAEFVVDTAVSAFFHSGTWGLAADEYRAVLQAGEIVVPKAESDQIRDNLGSQSDFEGLVGLTDEAQEAASTASPAGVSEYGRVGGGVGAVAGHVAVGVSGVVTPGARTAGRAIGGKIGEALAEKAADALGVRSMEGIRDALENGLIDETEAQSFRSAAKQADPEFGKNSLTGLLDTLNAIDAKMSRTIDVIMSPIEEAFSNMAMSGTAGHEAEARETVDSIDADPYGLGQGEGGDHGSGVEGTGTDMGNPGSDMGNMGDDPGDMAARYGGIFSGPDQGYPVELHNTEAVIPIPNGRSIPVEMRGADKKSAETVALLQEIKGLRSDIRLGNYQIAKNTGAIARMHKRWDGNGMPEERAVTQ